MNTQVNIEPSSGYYSPIILEDYMSIALHKPSNKTYTVRVTYDDASLIMDFEDIEKLYNAAVLLNNQS